MKTMTQLGRHERFSRIRATAARILMARDAQPNRTAAYAQAVRRAEAIALRCVQASAAPNPARADAPLRHALALSRALYHARAHVVLVGRAWTPQPSLAVRADRACGLLR
jgi:hypothetical protein